MDGCIPLRLHPPPKKTLPNPENTFAMPLQRAVSDPTALVSFRANDDPSVHFRPRPKIKPFPTSPNTYQLSPSLQLRSPKQLLLDWSDDLPVINELYIQITDMSSQPLEKAKVNFFSASCTLQQHRLITHLTSCLSQRIFFSSKMMSRLLPPLQQRLLPQTNNRTPLPKLAIRQNFSPELSMRVKPLQSQ